MSSFSWGELLKEAGESGNYEPLPDGDYDLAVIEATATQSALGPFHVPHQYVGATTGAGCG